MLLSILLAIKISSSYHSLTTMTSAIPDLVRRINKYHEHLSREQDTDLQHAYLSALIEAAQDLSAQVSHPKDNRESGILRMSTKHCDGAQGKTALKGLTRARDHGHVEGVIPSSLLNEEVDAFLENAAERGEEKDRDTGGGGLFVESETREELRESLPYVAKINLPVVSSQRGGLVEEFAARVAPAQETHQGGVDLDQVCPCTLQAHDCCYPGGESSFNKDFTMPEANLACHTQGCAMIKTCLKTTKGVRISRIDVKSIGILLI